MWLVVGVVRIVGVVIGVMRRGVHAAVAVDVVAGWREVGEGTRKQGPVDRVAVVATRGGDAEGDVEKPEVLGFREGGYARWPGRTGGRSYF